MSYDQYRDLVKRMSDQDLHREIVRNRARRSEARTERTREAWDKMLEACLSVQRLRDGSVAAVEFRH